MSPTTTIAELVRTRRDEILRIAERHGAFNVRVFGSVARGEAGPDSDLDLLVDFQSDRSLLDQIALTQELETLLGRKVQVSTSDALHWYIRDQVSHEARAL